MGLLVTLLLALCSLLVGRPIDLGIMAGMPRRTVLRSFLVVWTGCCMPVGVQRVVVDVPVRLRRGVRGTAWTRLLTCPLACREHCGLSAVAAHRQGLGADF